MSKSKVGSGPGLSFIMSREFRWEKLFTPTRVDFFSNTTGTQWEMDNLYDLRSWLLNFSDYGLVLIIAIFWGILSDLSLKFFMKIGQSYNMSKGDQLRFANSSWKYIFYIFSFSWGVFIAYTGGLYPNTTNCWANYPFYPHIFSLDFFYLVEMGFYVYSIFAFFAIEEKRSDAWLLLAHHVITLSLIYVSSVMNLKRIGILVLVAHDFSDIFLELGKTYVYKKQELMKAICFGLLTVSWVVTRLWIFPFHIIGSIIYEAPTQVPADYFFLVWGGFILFLSVLYVMHVYWFYLIVRILYKKLIQGIELTDDREDEEEDAKKQD